MAFDEGLAHRLREIFESESGITEKKMFGGLAFMSRDYMFIGIVGDTLMARVGPENYESALKRPHVRPMDFTGKPMKGYVYVDAPGFEDDDVLDRWVRECREFIDSLPAKAKK
jgi:TfoX/Sxy family transcriptional regulator of competence genes